MNQRSTIRTFRRAARRSLGVPTLLPMLAAILAIAPQAWAGVTDLSTQPLATLPTVQAKPNLLFVMDSSGSMNWSYMPDDLGYSRSITNEPYDGGAQVFGSGNRPNWYGYRSAQCNGLAFDPTANYSPPLRADGSSYPNAPYTAAPVDGYAWDLDHTKPTTNLSASSNSYYYQYNTHTGSPAAMNWTYTSSGVDTTTTFYTECSTTVTSPDPSFFTKVLLSSQSAAIQQKYANWYSYYSHRYLLMRTAMGRAIQTLDSNYRVGFSTIYDTTAQDGDSTTHFVDVKDFDSTQKSAFYTALYAVAPSGGTNLPDALSEAGRYFAHQITDQSSDPMQYACQRNYTLLSTDGYWNSNSHDFALDGTTRVGQQDGTENRPMKDIAHSTTTTKTDFTATTTSDAASNTQTRDIVWTRISGVSVGTKGTSSSGGTTYSNCTRKNYYPVSYTLQTATETQTEFGHKVKSATTKYTETVVTTDGVVTSDTSTTPTTGTYGSTTTTLTITDTSISPTTDTTPHTPPAGQFSSGTTVQVCTQTPPSNGDSNAAGAWSPSSLTYGTATVTTGAYTAATPTVTTSNTGASSDTLADVAEYYYKTDLRTTALGNCSSSSSGSVQDVCANIVKPVGADTAAWQHMNTFTIGLGTNGTLQYDKNYLTQTSGTYIDLTTGAQNWPIPNTSGDARNIDDLWHAAVDGRGQYYSALNATLLSEAIAGVVSTVQETTGSGASASTSSLELVAGDNNQVYKASYTTSAWTGDLQAFALDGATATVATTPTWSAQALLDTTTPSARTIYFNNGTTTLQTFSYTNLNSTQKGYFDNLCSQASVATQCPGLTGANLTAANAGANLIAYLRGDRTYESAVSGSTTLPLFRKREHVLGDIIDGAPVYVGKPPFSYGDAGYADFVTAQASRKPVVYSAANDGMLHAFSASASDGGTELWAYIPGAVMSNMYKLADSGYSSKHQYFVDGAPVMGDIKVSGTWKTILVGGLNEGGRSYYALDITDPVHPKPMWEFTDNNLGLSYGNPVITKRVDGTWVVVFGSGYNNVTGSGDGNGHLFVVDAATGSKLLDIPTNGGSSGSTPVGTTTTPSGLAKINAWIENANDNTSLRYYGGDLLGNVWRFDTENLVNPHQAALLLATLQVGSSSPKPQPITTRPETAAVSNRAVIVVATGRYLGTTDIADTTPQSIYAIADNLTALSGWGDVRSNTAFVQQSFTLSGDGKSASISSNAVDFSTTTNGGWYVDLPHSGERIATNMSLQFNTLVIGSAIPSGDACASGGASWRYFLNITNGSVVSSNPAGVLWNANALIVGDSWVKDSNGNLRVIYQDSNGTIQSEVPPISGGTGSAGAHRTSWRELSN